MKFNRAKIPINELLHSKRIISLALNIVFFILLTPIRYYCKIISNKNGDVLVISLHKLGDTVFTFSAIHELINHFGNKIKIICYPDSLPIYKLLFKEIECITIDKDDFYFNDRIANSKARTKIQAIKPEVIIDITCTMVSASLIFNSKAKLIVGSNGKHFKAVYDKFVTPRIAPKLTDIYLDAITPIINNPDRSFVDKIKIDHNSNGKILIQPFAGWKEKEWYLRNFILLGERLNKDYFVDFIIQSGQLDRDILEEIKSMGMEVIQTQSIEELIDSIKNHSVFIGNDSGPINIANYLGKSTLTIYGATNPSYSASNKEFQDYIIKGINCSAKQNEKYCSIGLAVYKCSGMQCMNSISVDNVHQKVIPLLNRYCVRKNF